MKRRKGRGRRKNPAQRPKDVTLRFLGGGSADGATLTVSGITPRQYGQVRDLARCGDIHDPLIMRFVHAFAAAIGSPMDAVPWTDADTVAFLRWLDLAPETEWTALEDAELAVLLSGEAASGG